MIKPADILRLVVGASAFLCACGPGAEPSAERSMFLMNGPAKIIVYGENRERRAEAAAAEIFAEWKRVSAEFSFEDPFSFTSFVNKKAYEQWIKVDADFLRLLELSLEYSKLTGGAFDVTFAPLWPLWKDAASSKILPSEKAIAAAFENIGSQYVAVDHESAQVRFLKPVKINMGGLLRGYCLERAYDAVKRTGAAPLEVRIGGYMLACGRRDWSYAVADPFHEGRTLGRLLFSGDGVVMSSSGLDHFVQIEGRLYSHILDLKTGYPINDFSNLIVYYPSLDSGYVPSAVLAVMGREKAFAALSKIKGATAVWIDGSGRVFVFSGGPGGARWEKKKGFLK